MTYLKNDTITVRQTMIIFTVATLSASIRLFPSDVSEFAKKACWISPAIGAIALLLLFPVLSALFKNRNDTNLSDVFELSLGKTAGKLLLAFYLFWSIVLYLLYIRYFGERLLTSIFPNTDMRFFILTMLIMVYIASRGKLETLARYSEFSFLLFTLVFIVFFVLLIPSVKLSNLYPVTQVDIIPAIKGTYPIIGIWGYITLLFFFGDHIVNLDKIKKQSKQCIAYLTIMTTLLIVFVVGSLGYTVAQRMPLPFFSATKLISIIEPLDRLEPVLLSIWVMADFIVITIFAMLIMKITGKLFSVSDTKQFASPVILLGYVGSQYLTSNRFELELFSGTVALSVNVIVCFLVPAIVLGIGKLRKKI